jgi:hypothetical protein
MSGGFVLNTGSSHGDINVFTSSSTTVTGPPPFAGESVNVAGTGSWATSISANSVSQAGTASTAVPVALPTGMVWTNGTIAQTTSTGFTITQGASKTALSVTVTAATVQMGNATTGEFAEVAGMGSLTSSIAATFVGYMAAAPPTLAVTGTVTAATNYGFMMSTSGNPSLAVIVPASAALSGAKLQTGSIVQVSGEGSLTSFVVATQVFVTDPTPSPTPSPTAAPTAEPTVAPTAAPTATPTARPTATPTVTPTAAPTARPTSTPVPTAPVSPVATAPMFAGCQVFPQGDPVYNTSIASLPSDPNSSSYISSFLAAGGNGNVVATGSNAWPINVATSATPTYPLVNSQTGNVVAGIQNFPFLSSYAWQNQGYQGADDRHFMVVNSSTCTLYEAYGDAAEPPAEWTVSGTQLQQPGSYAAAWNLSAPYPSSMSNGVNAAHVPQFAGMVRWEDIQSGCVCHALNIDVMVHALRSSAYVYPAQTPESSTYYQGPSAGAALALPLGARLRLASNYVFTCPSGVSDNCAQAKMIVAALQNYGAYVMDTGGYAGSIYLADELVNGTQSFPWNSGDIGALDTIPMSAFQVVAPPGCLTVESCVK